MTSTIQNLLYSTGTNAQVLPIIYDEPSYLVLNNPSSIQNVSNSAVSGYRISSYTGSAFTSGDGYTVQTTFNNSTNLTLSYEALICAGFVQSVTGYIDYTPYGGQNYSSLLGGRAITYAWNIQLPTGSATYTTLILNINNYKNLTVDANGNNVYTNSGLLKLYYRIEDTRYPVPSGTANYSSQWISANLSDATPGNAVNANNYWSNNTYGLQSSSSNGTVWTFNLTVPSAISSSSPSYLRMIIYIGFNIGSSFSCSTPTIYFT